MPYAPQMTDRRSVLIGAGALMFAPAASRASSRSDALDQLVATQMARASIPGLAMGITQDGAITSTRVYGLADIADRRPVTQHSMFHIASITKTVTALAILHLVEQGRIALDDPIARHLDFAIDGEGAAGISFRQLLTHCSGISDARYYEVDFRESGRDARLPLDDLLRGYLAKGGRYAGTGNIKTAPGTAWDYSNIGYGLLGHVGARVVGRDFREYIRDTIFAPMGLRHSSWSIAGTPAALRVTPYDSTEKGIVPVPPVGLPDWPAGALRASIGDLTRLVAIAANGGVVEGRRIVRAETVVGMLTMQRPAGLPDWLTGQGLGWQQSLLDGVLRANHWGGDPGVFTMAYVDPVRRRGAVLLSNLSATTESRSAMKAIAAAALTGNVTP